MKLLFKDFFLYLSYLIVKIWSEIQQVGHEHALKSKSIEQLDLSLNNSKANSYRLQLKCECSENGNPFNLFGCVCQNMVQNSSYKTSVSKHD